MKKCYPMFVLLIVLILVGCSKNPINDRIWYGNLYRTADDSLLSQVCLRYTGDTLEVYADAVFGAGKESLILKQQKKNHYVFVTASGEEFLMNFRYSENKSGKAEYLRVEGPDYRMQLTPVVGHDFTPELLAFYKGRAVPTQTSFYFSGRWKGEIIRIRDGQCLSPVCVEFAGDTMKVYAHAIFGRRFEVLYNSGYRDKAFHYVNNNGEFALYPNSQNGQIIFEGEGFYMTLDSLAGDWTEALRFYKGYEVTRNVDGYLFGTYVGQGIGRMANMDLLYALFNLSPDMLDIRLNVTLRFLEGGRVVETIKSECVNTQMNVILGITGNARSQRDAKIYNYSVSDNQLIIKKDKFTILENGDLVWRGVNDGKFSVETIVLRRIE